MIDPIYELGEAEVTCDEPNCRTQEMYDGFDGKVYIPSIVDDMKNDGWKITIKDGDWYHICPMCQDN